MIPKANLEVLTESSPEETIGELSALNCTAGDIRIVFDKNNPDETAKAKKMITDMLARGYMIFIKVDGQDQRIKKFDPKTEEYIVTEIEEKTKKERRVPMRKTKATAVPPTAGG